MCGVGFDQEKKKSLDGPNCPLPLSDCREETAKLFLHMLCERREGSK